MPPLSAPARLVSTASSCGCLEAKLCTAQRVVSESEMVAAGEPLFVKLPQCVHPVKIVSRIPLGGSLTHPVRLQGPAWEPDPELIEEMETPRLVVGPQGVTTGDLRIRAVHRGSQGADPSLLLTFGTGKVPGVYEGRVLVRPARNTRYRVSIPYKIAVVKME